VTRAWAASRGSAQAQTVRSNSVDGVPPQASSAALGSVTAEQPSCTPVSHLMYASLISVVKSVSVQPVMSSDPPFSALAWHLATVLITLLKSLLLFLSMDLWQSATSSLAIGAGVGSPNTSPLISSVPARVRQISQSTTCAKVVTTGTAAAHGAGQSS